MNASTFLFFTGYIIYYRQINNNLIRVYIMVDTKTLSLIQLAHPKCRTQMLDAYTKMSQALSKKSMVRFTCVMRTFAEQAALYAQGRTKPGKKVTNAPAGLSIHNYGLAFDIVLLIDKDNNGTYETASWDNLTDFDGDGISDWMECVKIAKSCGFSWGGDWKSFKDTPHFEMTFKKKPSNLLALKTSGKVDAQGYVLI
jgi:peptidoglycan L-alanyl-D-glutamate endopeptidase CwlK